MPRSYQEIIAEVFDIDPNKITDGIGQKDVEKWDSLNALLLIDELEKEYEISIPIEDVMEINTVKDIKQILKRHGVMIDEN